MTRDKEEITSDRIQRTTRSTRPTAGMPNTERGNSESWIFVPLCTETGQACLVVSGISIHLSPCEMNGAERPTPLGVDRGLVWVNLVHNITETNN